jgi:hypothetical protein
LHELGGQRVLVAAGVGVDDYNLLGRVAVEYPPSACLGVDATRETYNMTNA